jgi:hypothetical protein
MSCSSRVQNKFEGIAMIGTNHSADWISYLRARSRFHGGWIVLAAVARREGSDRERS